MPPLRTLFFIFLLSILAALLGWNYVTHLDSDAELVMVSSPTPSPTPTTDTTTLTPESAVAEILAAPLTIPGPEVLNDPLPPAQLTWIALRHPGMVTLFGTKVSTSAAQTTVAQLRAQYQAKPSVLIAVDHEGGTVQRLSGTGFTKLPSWQSFCNNITGASNAATVSANSIQSNALLRQSAIELEQLGIDLILAPVIDVGSPQAVLRTRICSDDPAVVVAKAAQFIETFQDHHIITTLKHFPGIGNTTRDLHLAFDRITVAADEAIVYRQLLDRFPKLSVLVTHVGVTNQYPNIPCSLSKDCIAELKQNYPHTLVISDALDMKAAQFLPAAQSQPGSSISTPPSLSQISINAVLAGNDMLLFGESVTEVELEEIYQSLLQRYRSDTDFAQVVQSAATKVKTIKEQHRGT